MARKICGNCFGEIKRHKCRSCGQSEHLITRDFDALPVGTVVGSGYVIGKVIGRGGFGIIYLAYDPLNERTAAIKEYFPNSVAVRAEDNVLVEPMTSFQKESFDTGLSNFINEANTISKFHECSEIIGVYDVFRQNGTAYYVMEYCNGISLMEYVEKYGAITDGQAVYIAKRILPALSVLHKNGTLHRDVSPENIMLCSGGSVRLVDFGSARNVDSKSGYSVVLKPGFAPLEQYRRFAEQDGRADIYSLGTSLYYALTLQIPNDPISRIDNDSNFTENLNQISDNLAEIIRKASAIKSADRYALSEDMLCDIIKCGINDELITLDSEITEKYTNKKIRNYTNFILVGAASFIVGAASCFALTAFSKTSFASQLPFSEDVSSEQLDENIPEFVIVGGESFSTSLEYLDLSKRGLTNSDIQDLRYCKNLVELNLNYNEITDLSCLSELVNLQKIHFNGNYYITDINFVENMTNLTSISGEYTEVDDISVLSDKYSLKSVFFGDSNVTDISPIEGADKLEKVGFNRCNIENIDALSEKTQLEMVCLTGCGLKSIEPLSNSKRLKYVYLGMNRLTDISALSGCFLTDLYVEYNYISSVNCFENIAVMDYLKVLNSGFDDEDIKQILYMVNGTYRYYYTDDKQSPFYGDDRGRLEDIDMINSEGL